MANFCFILDFKGGGGIEEIFTELQECRKRSLASYIGLSVISEIELLSFPGITSSEEQQIRSFIKDCTVLFLTENVKNKTIALRRSYKIKLPDAIIAATAIENNLQLITADKGFKQIAELDLALIEPEHQPYILKL